VAGDAAKYKIMVYANHCVVKVRTGHITKKRVWVALKAGSLGECEEFLREKRQVEPAQVRRVKGRSRKVWRVECPT
jgi:hypothetical protein